MLSRGLRYAAAYTDALYAAVISPNSTCAQLHKFVPDDQRHSVAQRHRDETQGGRRMAKRNTKNMAKYDAHGRYLVLRPIRARF